MKRSSLIIILITALLGGILFYAINEGFIVFHNPRTMQQSLTTSSVNLNKKKVKLIWYTNTINSETTELIWSDDIGQNIYTIISRLLVLMHEEQLTHETIKLDSVLVSNTNQAYISFDRVPFAKDATIHHKWLFIESIIKTIAANDIPTSSIWFLVRHQLMLDAHLDFSNPWPISGFFERTTI
jgi:hypothetical protein